MKPQNSVSQKFEYYVRSLKKGYFKQKCQASEKYVYFHALNTWLGLVCMNCCINAVCHGGNQPVALLRCIGSPGCFDSGLQVICIVGSGVSHLSLDNTHRFSLGFRSGEFAGQSSTVTPWSLNQLLVPLAV